VHPEGSIIIEIFGEGKTEVGPQVPDPKPEPPLRGAIPIIVNALCGRPSQILVKRNGNTFLHRIETGRVLWKKVWFARRQAFYNGSHATVFVVDSEGDIKSRYEALCKGRDEARTDLPMAVGVAHPCIESWLLADPDAVRKGLNLSKTPDVPPNPEELPAPQKNRSHNPKTVLKAATGIVDQELSANQKDRIAAVLNMELVKNRCPQGFAPFANEVEKHIRPLFSKS
jgi:hypothetical protein